MKAHVWAYLWDIDAIGVERALDELRAVGVTGLSVATSYHAGRFVQPRLAPYRMYYPEDGTVHVPIPEGSGAIKPLVSEFGRTHPDLLHRLQRVAFERNMVVSSWTVMLHNTRLGAMHPDATVQNVWGARLRYNLCPSHPAVRQYAVGLVARLSRQYGFPVIELESLGYMGLVHEFHHEKDGVGLSLAEQILMSLCFCPYCTARAEAAGVDVAAARLYVSQRLSDAFEREVPAEATPLQELWESEPLRPFLEWRVDNVHLLLREIKHTLPQSASLRVLDLFGPGESRWYGLDYSRVLEDADSVCCCLYDQSPGAVRENASRIVSLTGTPRGVWAGYRLFYPEVLGRDDFQAKVLAAHDAGVEDFYFYNYGLVPRRRLQWIQGLWEVAR